MENENIENIEQNQDGSNNEFVENNFVSVKIFDQDISLKITDVSKEYLENISGYIDETVKLIKEANPYFNDKMVLTLAALNIADMLHRKEFENDEQRQYFSDCTNNLHEKTMTIIQMIDNRKNKNSKL